jgi:hypothetical protein
MLGVQQASELFHYLQRQIRRNIPQIRNLFSQPLNIRLRQILQNLFPQLVPNRYQENRSLAHTAQRLPALGSRQRT